MNTSHMYETSLAARRSIDVGKVDTRVLQYVKHFGGVTCDEVEQGLDMRHQTASAALNRLFRAGEVGYSDQRRPTRSGRLAIVWRAA